MMQHPTNGQMILVITMIGNKNIKQTKGEQRMKVKELFEQIMEMDIEDLGVLDTGRTKSQQKRETVQKEAKENPVNMADVVSEVTEFKGEKNPMKLKSMAKAAGMETNKSTTKAEAIAYLIANEKGGDMSAPKTGAANKAKGEKLTKENYDKTKKYTEEQLNTCAYRPLYEIAREQFDIPRAEIGNKADVVAALLAAQEKGVAPKSKKTAKNAKEEVTDYKGMKAKELYDLCVEREIDAEKRKPATYYIELLSEYDAEQELDEDESIYASMTAKELYLKCKASGIKIEQKLDKQEYIDALEAAEDEDADGWEDEEEDSDDGAVDWESV